MPDRAVEVAATHIRVLTNDAGTWGIDFWGTWFDCPGDSQEDVASLAGDIRRGVATAFRAYAEEAVRTRLQGELWAKGDLNRLSCGCWFRACSATHEEPVRVAEEARLEDRKASAAWWDDTEARAEEAHAVYQREAHRRGDVRHLDAYADLPEDTKEWDRVLMRWVAAAIRARGEKG